MFDLRGIVQEHPDCLKNHDRRKLKGILSDLYPSDKRLINLVLDTYDSGVPDQLTGLRELDSIRMQTLVRVLMDDYGMREEIAAKGVRLWADALGVKTPPYNLPSSQKPALQKPDPLPRKPELVQKKNDPPPQTSVPQKHGLFSRLLPTDLSPSQTPAPVQKKTVPPPQTRGLSSYPLTAAQARVPDVYQFILTQKPDGWYIQSYSGILPESLTIPAIIDGKTVIGISNRAFMYSGSSSRLNGRESGKALRRVTFEAGIQHIGERAFESCEGLQNVHLPDTLKTIGREAFQHCISLTYIHLPNGFTEIQTETFAYCEKLTSISIPKSVAIIGGGAFMGCDNLEIVKFSHGLETIKISAFRDCPKLKEAILPDSVKIIENFAFCGDSRLKRLRLNEGLISIGDEAFVGCSMLQDVILPRSLTSVGRDPFHTYLEDRDDVSLRDWLRRLQKDPTVSESGAYHRNKQLTMYCHKDTYGEAYARRAGYRVRNPANAPAYLR